MSSEKMAYHAGKFAAQTVLTDGAVRILGSGLQIARLEMPVLCQATKEGAGELAAAAKETVSQAAGSISQAAKNVGQAVAEVAQGKKTGEKVMLAGVDGAFKTALKNPGIKQACEKLAASPPKMEFVTNAGTAGLQSTKRAIETSTNATLVDAGSTLRKVEFADGLRHARTHHLFGDKPFSLKNLDPLGNPDKWAEYINKLAQTGSGTVKKVANGEILEIMGTMLKTGGGELKIGVRLFKAKDAEIWKLATLLTIQ